MDDALQNKCICNESGSACSDKQAGDKEVITDSGRTMNKCIYNESGSECSYKQAGELKAADSGRQRQTADNR